MSKIGYGSIVKFATDNIGELLDISGPSLAKDTVETTHMGSPDKFRTFIGGLRDGGEITLSIAWDEKTTATGHTKLRQSLEEDDESKEMVIDFSKEQTTCTAQVLVTGYSPTAPLEDRMTADVTLKVSGKPTWGDTPTQQ